jgi:thioredoxin reductase
MKERYDVVVLGAGPAGLAAAIGAREKGAGTLVIEREARMGGILKQCIHDGFGVINFGDRLTGPEYAARYLREFHSLGIDSVTSAYVTDARRAGGGFELQMQTAQGIQTAACAALVLACGCRERTARQAFIHGDRPAGIFTAGTAQYYVNVMGYLPTKTCVILGSGDIGLIMARRLTLEGAHVEGVYEIKSEPSGLARNVSQCLEDFGIPLHLSTTVTNVIGRKRVEAVEVCRVDENMKPIPDTARWIPCDALILSVGLIPENEIAEKLGVEIDAATKGPWVDQRFMTSVPGVFCCGNALHVHDLVDYVSSGAAAAGANAADYKPGSARQLIGMEYGRKDFLYVVPQYYDAQAGGDLELYFRSRTDRRNASVSVEADGAVVQVKTYQRLNPSEMERLSAAVPENPAGLSVDMEDVQ